MRSPRDVVLLYNDELWNRQRYELADEIIGDEVIRHDVGSVRTLTRAESLQRVVDQWAKVQHIGFTILHLLAEGELVSAVYQCEYVTLDGDTEAFGSIEVFRVVDGRLVEVWNAPYGTGTWR